MISASGSWPSQGRRAPDICNPVTEKPVRGRVPTTGLIRKTREAATVRQGRLVPTPWRASLRRCRWVRKSCKSGLLTARVSPQLVRNDWPEIESQRRVRIGEPRSRRVDHRRGLTLELRSGRPDDPRARPACTRVRGAGRGSRPTAVPRGGHGAHPPHLPASHRLRCLRPADDRPRGGDEHALPQVACLSGTPVFMIAAVPV